MVMNGTPSRFARLFVVGVLLLAAGRGVVRGDEAPPAPEVTDVLPEQAAGSDEQAPADPSAAVSFENDILPIFEAHCVRCHGIERRLRELDLSSPEGVLKGGESGDAVVAGKPEQSRLLELILSGKMPADGKTEVTEAEIAAIRAWIESLAAVPEETLISAPATEQDVIPIMLLRCAACHGRSFQEGELDLRTRASILKGGKSGPAIVAGKPDESRLVQLIREGAMPPKGRLLEAGVREITASEIEKVVQWVAAGAPEAEVGPDVTGAEPDPLVSDEDRQFWAFQPPKAVEPPAVIDRERARNPIDAFILRKLQEQHLTLSPDADKSTLLRRASLDLIGLPPEPDEARAFLADEEPDAYEKLIDRLLESPHYGERWGRHWLDAVGYHDWQDAWRYRDYVIRSLNADKPYDLFLHEQIAGDELIDYENAPAITQEINDNLIATGFMRMAVDPTQTRLDSFVPKRLDVIADQITIFSTTVLGLSMQCARCHSHKFDPIPQRDYYRLAAVFKGAFDEHNWLAPMMGDDPARKWLMPGQRRLPYMEPLTNPLKLSERRRRKELADRGHRAKIEALEAELKAREGEVRESRRADLWNEIPETVREDVKAALDTPEDQRTELQRYLAEKFGDLLNVDREKLKQLDEAFKKYVEDIEGKIGQLKSRLGPPGPQYIRALWDRGNPSPTYILKRGDAVNFGRRVGPGVPSVLTDGKTPFVVEPPWPGAKQTGRRLALARWLTEPGHPLTARVMVNRIWQGHFGEAIVATPGNFGQTGARPTHPELLDWLALEFVRQGWSIKAMHRLIMTSSAYRQASTVLPAHSEYDPENALLSRMTMQRMDAEALRDSIITVASRLDRKLFGGPVGVAVRADGLATASGTGQGWRRSVYVKQETERSTVPTILESFDFPQMSPNCMKRTESTVAPQALHLMNDSTIRGLAEDFAKRLREEAGEDRVKQIERAYLIALARAPTDEEREIGLEALSELADNTSEGGEGEQSDESPEQEDEDRPLVKYCHTLINSAAFLYID